MHTAPRPDLFHGVFELRSQTDGCGRVVRSRAVPRSIPDPLGHLVRISTVEATTRAICPRCAHMGEGGFVSFESDLRLAYACPSCRVLVWVSGA